MSKRTKLFLIGLVLAVIAVPVLMILARDNRPDSVLIKEAVARSIEASKEGRPGGVVDFLSAKFKINQIGDISMNRVAQIIKDSKPEVTVTNQEPRVSGDLAEIVSDVRVVANVSVLTFSQQFDQTFKDVKMVFTKEDSRRFLLIPTKTWRLTSVELTGADQMLEGALGN